jgi:hypothetical protein
MSAVAPPPPYDQPYRAAHPAFLWLLEREVVRFLKIWCFSILEYHALGIDEFIFSGYPHLEEIYSVGEGVAPALRRAGLLEHEPQLVVA